MTEPLETFRQAMSQAGLVFDGAIIADDKLHRFNCRGENGNAGYYVLHKHERFFAGMFGCFRRGISQSWNSVNGEPLSKEDMIAVRRSIEAAQKLQRTEQEAVRFDAKQKAQRALNEALPADQHPYLTRKDIPALGEIRITNDGLLLLPLRDFNGALHSLQLIAPDKRFPGGRDKSFLLGGRTQGCFYTVEDRKDAPFVIAEGYATGVSIHIATGWNVLCAMSAQNLEPVAKAFRTKFSSETLVIAADNDRFTDGNPGHALAQAAAKAARAQVALPEFSDQDLRSTDFNDLARLEGFHAVKTALTRAAEHSGDWSVHRKDGCNLQLLEIVEPVKIIENIFTERSKLVIGGASKTNKTWMTMTMALCIATGKEFLGNATIKKRVLYVDLEMNPDVFTLRLQMICKAHGITLEKGAFSYLSLRGKLHDLNTSKEIIDKLLPVARKDGAEVIVIDPVYKVNLDGDENSARDQTRLFKGLDVFTSQLGASLIIVDHFGKGDQSEKDPLDTIRGSSAKAGDLDAALIIRRHRNRDMYSIDIIQRSLKPIEPFVVSFNCPLFSIEPLETPDDFHHPGQSGTKIASDLGVLNSIADRDQSNPISGGDWADLAGLCRRTLVNYRQRLHLKGFITTIGHGNRAKYAITPQGVNALASRPLDIRDNQSSTDQSDSVLDNFPYPTPDSPNLIPEID